MLSRNVICDLSPHYITRHQLFVATHPLPLRSRRRKRCGHQLFVASTDYIVSAVSTNLIVHCRLDIAIGMIGFVSQRCTLCLHQSVLIIIHTMTHLKPTKLFERSLRCWKHTTTDSLNDVVEHAVDKKTTNHTENIKQTKLLAAKGKLLTLSK